MMDEEERQDILGFDAAILAIERGEDELIPSEVVCAILDDATYRRISLKYGIEWLE